LIGLATAANVSAQTNAPVIAVAGPMTGQYAAFGHQMVRGARAAVASIANSDRMNGTALDLVVEDDACDATQAADVARRLVARNVQLVIGHHCASATRAAAPIYAAADVIMITPSTGDPWLTDQRAGPSIFRLAPRSDAATKAMAAHVIRAYTGQSIAILHDRTVASQQTATAVKNALNAMGVTNATTSGFLAGEKDYRPLIASLDARQIKVVIFAGYPMEAAQILASIAEAGSELEIVGDGILSGSDFALAAGSVAGRASIVTSEDPIYWPNLANSWLDTQPQVTSAQRLVSVLAYASVEVWSAAAGKIGGDRPGRTVAARLQTERFPSKAGAVAFDQKGDVLLEFFTAHRWHSGELRRID
jgi:branched-chain amino acid transport system substrate-binding protein